MLSPNYDAETPP